MVFKSLGLSSEQFLGLTFQMPQGNKISLDVLMTPLLRYLFFLVKGFLVKPLRLQIVTSKETTNTQTAYLKSSTNNPAGISVNSMMTIQKASGCLIFREIFLLRGSTR